MPDRYSFGIEEEYFLVDAQTKSVARTMHEGFLDAAKEATGGRVTGEFLQSQIEVMTSPHVDMASAREELRNLRQTIAKVAAEHGLAILAAGTHPTAIWSRSRQSEGERYDTVMDDLQMIGQRNMLCGLHVHVELPNANERVDVMTRMLPYLPLFVALATSSPFWQSRQTGLMGYRLAAYDELPRTGVPELFKSQEDFDSLYRGAGESRRDREFKLYLVGDPPLAQASDARIARAGLLHAGGRHDRASRRCGARWRAGSTAIRGSTGTSTRSRARSWSRTNGARSATACTARSSISAATAPRPSRRCSTVDRRDRDRRRKPRLPARSAALPRHRRRRHLGRRADRRVQGQGRQHRAATSPCARSPTGSRRRRCSSLQDALLPPPAARSAPRGRARAHRPRRARAKTEG